MFRRLFGKDTKNETMLQACMTGDISAVKALVASGADVNTRDSEYPYRTPLMWAVKNRHAPVIHFLINSPHINLGMCDNWDRTALSFACWHGADEATLRLLLSKMDMGMINKRGAGGSAIMQAVRRNNLAGVRLLCEMPGLVWRREELGRMAR